MRIKTKMMLYILFTTSMVYIAAIGFITMRNRAKALENAEQLTDTYVREYANAVETSLNEDIAVARSMAQVFTGYESLNINERERIYDEFLENILKSNTRYIAVFLQWEIGAIDKTYTKPYGRLRKSGSWMYTDSSAKRKKVKWALDTLDTEGDDMTGIYYQAKSTGNEIITNPYFYAYTIDAALPSDVPVTDDDVLESTIIIPIFKDDKYIGLTGMDIPLNSFQSIINKIKPFEDSYSFLVANNGSFVAHPILKNIQGSITVIDSVFAQDQKIVSYIQEGKPFSFIEFDDDSREIYVSIAPVRIGRTKTPWAMGIAIPVDVIKAGAMRNFYIAVLVGVLGLIILAIVIWMISGSITKPLIGTTNVLKGLAKGSVDESMVQEVKSKDEIGEMTRSANTLVNFLKTTTLFAKKIGDGDLKADYHLLSDEDVLGNALIEMREKLKTSTEKIQSQAVKLKQTNRDLEKLSVVARETDNAVVIMDAGGDLEWVNEGLKRLYGYSLEEYISEKGKSFFQVSSNPKIKELFEECVSQKRAVYYTSKNTNRAGEEFYAQTTLSPVLTKKGEVTKVVAIDSDITKLILAEEEINEYAKKLKSQRDTLQSLNATKDRFFAIIAHDLKNPFGALHSMIDTLREGYANFEDDERMFYIEHLQTIANRIYNLLDNLLLWANAQRGRVKFEKQVIAIHELVSENIRLASPSAERKMIRFEEHVSEDIKILADFNMINTVVRNLITNALKYSNPGGNIKVSAEIIDPEKNGKYVMVTVRDNGVGIDGDTLDKLFRIDQNPSTRGTADEKGSGLGLILCREFVEQNGGEISVVSKVNIGSEFRFTVLNADAD